MKSEWRRWSVQFAARAPREKWILALATLVVVYAAVDTLWLTSALKLWRSEAKLLAQKQADLAQLSAQVALLNEQARQQEIQIRSALEASRRDLESVAGQLAGLERTLVPARRMTAFLQGLLPGRGVEVLALKTLSPTPLIVRSQPKPAEGTAGAVAPTGDTTAPAENLYKHGVEITLVGSYPALLDYLDRLEKSPQKVIFGHLALRADKYPRSELTLTLYTLSLDRSWLIV